MSAAEVRGDRVRIGLVVAGVLAAGAFGAAHLPGGSSADQHRQTYGAAGTRQWSELGDPVSNVGGEEKSRWEGSPIEHLPIAPQADAPADPSASPAPSSGGKCQEDQACWNPRTMGNGRGEVPGQPRTSGSGVTVNDETGGAFPVASAVASWDIPNIRVGECQPGSEGCIDVALGALSPERPNTIREGHTTWTQAGTARIVLNPATPESAKRQVIAHELGHAFGLEHQAGTVMEPMSDGAHPTPNAELRAEARRNLGAR
jgi:hypothetical protein